MVRQFAEAFATLEKMISEWEAGRDSISILEAGGGSLSKVKFAAASEVTVVDISVEQLDRNTVAAVKILGDLHSVEIESRFDAVVCYDVLEHLRDPGLVARKLCGWLAPGGILLVAAPNRRSLSGLITRATPHWFHVFVYKYLFGSSNAGKPGYAPFPTVHHPDIDPLRLKLIVGSQDAMTVTALIQYQGTQRAALRQKSPIVGAVYDRVLAALGLLNPELSESDFFLTAVKAR